VEFGAVNLLICGLDRPTVAAVAAGFWPPDVTASCSKIQKWPLEPVKRRQNGTSLATEASTKRRDTPSAD
jgi:hypothetical protein